MKFYQLIISVILCIVSTNTVFRAAVDIRDLKISLDICNVIDEFLDNNEHREINHTQTYSPLLDLITNHTDEKASLGKDIAYSIFITVCQNIVSIANNIRANENRLTLPYLKCLAIYFCISLIGERAKNLIQPELKYTILDEIICITLIHGFNLFFRLKPNFFSDTLIKYITYSFITSKVTNLLSGSHLCLKYPEKITINNNRTVSVYGRPEQPNGFIPVKTLSLPNMQKFPIPLSLHYQGPPTTQVTRDCHSYTLRNGKLFICLADDDNVQSRADFRSYPVPQDTTTFDVSLDENHIAFLTQKRVHLWKLRKSKPLDEIMNSEVDL